MISQGMGIVTPEGFAMGPLGFPVSVKSLAVALTVAQVQGLNLSPVSIIPAPPTGKVILPLCVYHRTIITGAGANSQTLSLRYVGTTSPTNVMSSWQTFTNQIVGTYDTFVLCATSWTSTVQAAVAARPGSAMEVVANLATTSTATYRFRIYWVEAEMV